MSGNEDCHESQTFFTSQRCKLNTGKQGLRPFQVNVSSKYAVILAMRLLGKGLIGMDLFSGIMNMGKSMSKEAYSNLLGTLESASQVVSKKSMLKASREIQDDKDSADISNATCMFDGTWQRRGFSSFVGVVACISADNSKVIDLEIMRKPAKSVRSL